MPTPQSARYLCSVKLMGRQPGDMHIFSTKNGGYSIRITWIKINPPSTITERKTFGPYEDLIGGIQVALKWFYKTYNPPTPDG